MLDRALRSRFEGLENDDELKINETRAIACEYIAWRIVLQLSEWECIDNLLDEIPTETPRETQFDDDESAPLLHSNGMDTEYGARPRQEISEPSMSRLEDTTEDVSAVFNVGAFTSQFQGLNALEIAAVTEAKKFLSQAVVQRLIEKIWKGDIVFWERLDVDAVKEPRIYNPRFVEP
jgi:hypothetical protein